jgi:hypothetical protein
MKRMKPVTMMQIIKHPLVQIFQRKMERIMKQMVLSFFFFFFLSVLIWSSVVLLL